MFSNLSQTWFKFKNILEKSGDFAQKSVRLVYEWVTLSWKIGICTSLRLNSAQHIPTNTKLEYPPGSVVDEPKCCTWEFQVELLSMWIHLQITLPLWKTCCQASTGGVWITNGVAHNWNWVWECDWHLADKDVTGIYGELCNQGLECCSWECCSIHLNIGNFQ